MIDRLIARRVFVFVCVCVCVCMCAYERAVIALARRRAAADSFIDRSIYCALCVGGGGRDWLPQVNAIASSLCTADLMASLSAAESGLAGPPAPRLPRAPSAADLADGGGGGVAGGGGSGGGGGGGAVGVDGSESAASVCQSERDEEEGANVVSNWAINYDSGMVRVSPFRASRLRVTVTNCATQEAAILFDPAKGNVAFASALDGWAFTV